MRVTCGGKHPTGFVDRPVLEPPPEPSLLSFVINPAEGATIKDSLVYIEHEYLIPLTQRISEFCFASVDQYPALLDPFLYSAT
jgi:hypothetical protein